MGNSKRFHDASINANKIITPCYHCGHGPLEGVYYCNQILDGFTTKRGDTYTLVLNTEKEPQIYYNGKLGYSQISWEESEKYIATIQKMFGVQQ